MPQFLTLLLPDEARALLLSHLPQRAVESESINVISSLNRILAEDIITPHPLPEFPLFTLAHASGLLRILPHATGLRAGEWVQALLI